MNDSITGGESVILFPQYEELKNEVQKLRTELSMLVLERDELQLVECKNIEMAYLLALSRMIWYSGSALWIFIAMLILFLPMLISFFLALGLSDIPNTRKMICIVLMIISCAVLYLGAMEMMPSDGKTMTSENIWHGALSFGGMLMIFLTYCLYTFFNCHSDRDGTGLIAGLLVFILITGAFAVLNVFDVNSYVIASAVSELYVLTMLSLTGYLTYYLAYRNAKANSPSDMSELVK